MRQIFRKSPAGHKTAGLLALTLWAALPAGAQTNGFGLQWVGYGVAITDASGAFGVPLANWTSLDDGSGSTTIPVPSGGAFSVTWGTGGGIWWDEDATYTGLTTGDDQALSGCLYAAQADFSCSGPISVTITGMNSVATGSYAISLGGAVAQSSETMTMNPATVTDASNNTYTLNFTAPGYFNSSDGSLASITTNLTLSGDSIAFTICNDDGNLGYRAVLSEMTVQFTPVPAPVVTTSPLSQTVPENGNASFTVGATGGAVPLTYAWFFDGALMTGRTNATLNLTGVSDGNSGSYQAQVTDAKGYFSLSSAATLVVAPAGSFVLYDASTWSGYNNVGAYPPGIANYFSVVPGTSVAINQLGFDSTTNVLTDEVTVQLWDVVAGQVLATVTFGASDSSIPVGSPTAYLYLKAPATGVKIGPGTYAAAQYGGTYCNLPDGETINTANGAIVEGLSYYNGLSGPGTLPGYLDGPTYPTYLGPNLQYTVSGGPVITQQPAGGVFTPGDTVTLSVTANGSLPLSYLWSRNNSSLGITTPGLTLTNVTAANSGTYTVAVNNTDGTAISSPAVVTVAVTPVVSVQVNPAIVIQGTVGAPYQVQYSTALASSNWIPLQSIPALPSSPYTVYDPAPASAGQRYYRAIVGQ